jgi:hypothetical protein
LWLLVLLSGSQLLQRRENVEGMIHLTDPVRLRYLELSDPNR